MPRRTHYDKPFPHCDGPKLHQFRDHAAPISLVRLISQPVAASETSSQAQAHVFEASISSKTYALKIFRYYDDTDDLEALTREDRKHISADIVRSHRDPFLCECRAYGRLIEKNLNGKVAVRCHGYLTLPADREEELQRKFHVGDWNRPRSEYDKPPHKRQPFRAIVKDLITADIPLTEKVAKVMLKHLKQMRRVGVYPMDVTARNYVGGLLVDFSIAITTPHYLFEIKTPMRVRFYQRNDLISWQSMVRDAGIETWERAVPSSEYRKKLRPRDETGRARKS
ncbi:hypothetical protein ACLMJK_006382 [Lecanora helva]